ncbi:MAG: GNAT family N-acetyltransferase [Desulfovibrio sp.]|nr:GNAT family N-acetyltransferase [Desulfovibrio sp.]
MNRLDYSASLTAGEYCRLRAAVGWPELPLEEAREGLSHSAFIAACRKNGDIIGAVRIVWDHGYIAYFSDLMVLPAWQGRGIGRELARRALAWVKGQRRPGWKIKVVLISTAGNEGFYKKLGFTERPSDGMGAGMDLWLQ